MYSRIQITLPMNDGGAEQAFVTFGEAFFPVLPLTSVNRLTIKSSTSRLKIVCFILMWLCGVVE
jgi:hypothetical protein